MSPPEPVRRSHQDLACKDFVQIVTAYLDDALPADVRADVDEHLAECDGCQNLLAQWRTVIDVAREFTEADVDNTDHLTRNRLLSIFRRLQRR